jgi:hypothetical protein
MEDGAFASFEPRSLSRGIELAIHLLAGIFGETDTALSRTRALLAPP